MCIKIGRKYQSTRAVSIKKEGDATEKKDVKTSNKNSNQKG